MASGSEIVLPIGTQKHDPAWKHCLMIKANERTQLKCKYCFKLFLGGGIHRIKEHLARHKGNAAGCPQVPMEVQQAMQQSLEAVEAKRKKKTKIVEEELGGLHPNTSQMDVSEVDNGKWMVAMPMVLDSVAAKEDVPKSSERGRRKRVKCSVSPLSTSDASLLSVSNSGSIKGKDHAYMSIARFLYEAGVPLDVMGSAYFQPMIEAIVSAGPGFRAPSYHDLRGSILKRSIEEVNTTLERYKETWARTGCSVLADEWTTEMGLTVINFLVHCPEGMMFLKSFDASNIVTSAEALYELLKHVVEEVGVKNVVQIITNNTECHVLAGKRLTGMFPTMFWVPCPSRCTDAVLEELGRVEWISEIIEQAKYVTGFIYNHGVILNMMRKYTNGKELVLPNETHFALNFSTLKRITDLKDELTAMVTSQEWKDSPYTKTLTGNVVAGIICGSGSSFWPSCDTAVRLTEPLVRLLRIVDGNRRPAMGYAYAGMYLVKKAIKKVWIDKDDYMPYWGIIERIWNKQLPHPLHMAGFFLNPRYFYNIQEIPNEISSGMLECVERLVPDPKIQDKINKEISLYKNAAGDFGRKMAVRGRDTLFPAEWWSTYGGGCPNLTRLAIRILSQTCSVRGCEQNRNPFEKIHYQRMNYLERQRLHDLIFVQYNLRLQQRKAMKSKQFDPISLDNIDVVDDWVMEKAELLSGENKDFSWTVLNQPVADGVLSDYENGENAEVTIAEFGKEVIGGADPDSEDANCRGEDGSHDSVPFTCSQIDQIVKV